MAQDTDRSETSTRRASVVPGKRGEGAGFGLAKWSSAARNARASLLSLLIATALAIEATERQPLIVFNGSASAPRGFYLVSSWPVHVGQLVLAWAPDDARTLAARRGYLPRSVPLLKHVAAAERDRVCAWGKFLFVNGRAAALRLSVDGAGRPLPMWSGCRILGQGEVLLLNGHPRSFDGRYFGVTSSRHVIASARAIWVL